VLALQTIKFAVILSRIMHLQIQTHSFNMTKHNGVVLVVVVVFLNVKATLVKVLYFLISVKIFGNQIKQTSVTALGKQVLLLFQCKQQFIFILS